MRSPDTSSHINIHIDNNAIDTGSDDGEGEGEGEGAPDLGRPKKREPAGPSDITCLSAACCSRFAALTGLDLHAIQRELGANHSAILSGAHGAGDHKRSAFEGGPDHRVLHLLEKKAMALHRVDGSDELFVGGVFALTRPGAMEALGITSILSMITYSLAQRPGFEDRYAHLSVDVDDVDDEDMVVHLPRAVRFIERGLRGGSGAWPRGTVLPGPRATAEADAAAASGVAGGASRPRTTSPAASEPRAPPSPAGHAPAAARDSTPGGVFVHCAMGKSRSVTAVVAYLLRAYPHRYGLAPGRGPRPAAAAACKAVQAAVAWVGRTREIADPNPGFVAQLEMWVMMGCPADTDDAVERHGMYQRWLWAREVRDSARLGQKPDWLRFEDEVERQEDDADTGGHKSAVDPPGKELRCRKCRRVLATQQFIVPHPRQAAGTTRPCPHHFVEALSWMRPVLEAGELEGRLICPSARCGASLGRYSWKGFQCGCNEWVCPAFALAASKVDEVATVQPGGPRPAEGMPAHGIRMPPGKQNL